MGFRDYWYPAAWSRQVDRKPIVRRLLGDPVMLRREAGTVYALYDQCPHRGIPLSVGRQEFAGTWSCRYHGWTYRLASGELDAALTDGPDSPLRGKVCVRTYPVQERAGIVWVWMGAGPAVPLEADVPVNVTDTSQIKEGAYVTSSQGNIALANHAPHPNAARVFINWVLSKEGQETIVKAMKIPSTRVDVTTAGFRPQEIPRPEWVPTHTEEALKIRDPLTALLREVLVRCPTFECSNGRIRRTGSGWRPRACPSSRASAWKT